MHFEIRIEHVLIFCIAQTLLLIAILLQKRFHQIPNLFLGFIFGLLTSLYVIYLLEYLNIFDSYPILKVLKKAMELIPPPLVYNYLWLLIYGETKLKKGFEKHFILPGIAFILFIALIIISLIPSFSLSISNQLYSLLTFLGSVVVGINFYVYGYKMILLIKEKSRSNKSVFKCLFSISEKRYRWVRLMAIIFFAHGTIFLIEGVYLSIYPEINAPLLINTIFYITVGYVFSINLIQNPAIIHFSSKTAGNLVLKKYEKSGLTEEEAGEIMKKMNNLMEMEKPFLNSNLSIQDLSEALAIPIHTISEVTNGLIGQNFFDYLNNYRIEEFKRLATQSKNDEIKILHLAFDAGFSSKTSFNLAFKKFTCETPSQFMKKIKQ